MDLADTSSVLWRQRQLLEQLLFRLEVEQLLLASGRARWLAQATDDVERVLDELRLTELARAVAIDEVAATLGLPSGCSLRELTLAAPAPYDTVFSDHRAAFLRLTAEVDATATANRELLHRAQGALRGVVGSPSGGDGIRSDLGRTTRVDPMLVDEVI